MEHCSTLKKKANSDTCYNMINFKDLMLSEMSLSKKGDHLFKVPRIVKFTETVSRMVVARSWGER